MKNQARRVWLTPENEPRMKRLTPDQRCLCRGCNTFFKSTRAFEKHRIGTGEGRRCMTADEMSEAGLYEEDGFMRFPPGKAPKFV